MFFFYRAPSYISTQEEEKRIHYLISYSTFSDNRLRENNYFCVIEWLKILGLGLRL